MSNSVSLDELERGVIAGDRTLLARAITLVESRAVDARDSAQELLARLLPRTGKAYRVGVTGVPGVGKSTFIETLGIHLVESGHRVAVLAVDPSSSVSGGSILGDKSRMGKLAQHDSAYIRPSPNAQTLGGVSVRTRETMLVCEAAGFDVVLVETVGVGQSETVVAQMVDFFLVLMLARAGDELQGIKRGIVELADLIAVNKADGDNVAAAKLAQTEFAAALRYLQPRSSHWRPQATTVSALTGDGVIELWSAIEKHRVELQRHGELDLLRQNQRREWMWSVTDELLQLRFREHAEVRRLATELEERVARGETPATQAAEELLGAFWGG